MNLSPEARELLEAAAPAEPGPSRAQRARVLKGIRSAIVPAMLLSAPAKGGAAKGLVAKLTGAKLFAAKVVVAGVTAVTVATAATGLYHHVSQPPPKPAPAQRVAAPVVPPERLAEPEPAPVELEPTPEAPPVPTEPPPARESSPTAAKVNPDQDFARQLQAAQKALALLDANQPDQALEQVQAAKARWPKGSFRQELDVIEVLAWCAHGDTEKARTAAAALRKRGVDDAVNRRLADSCVSE